MPRFPLGPVHPNARLAADAAEAAGAQGRFWEMHDLPSSNQDRLSESGLLRHAARLELDTGRFERDLASLYRARCADEHRAGGERSGVDLLLLVDADDVCVIRKPGAEGNDYAGVRWARLWRSLQAVRRPLRRSKIL